MYILIHVSTLLLSVVIKIYPARWPLIDCEGVYSHGSINSDPARGMKSIPIYYMIYELHYFNRREGGNAAASKRRENNREAGQEVMFWLPKRVLEHGEGWGRQDLVALAPRIHSRVGRGGLDLKSTLETSDSGMRGSSPAQRKTPWQLCSSVSLLLSRI